MSEDRESFSQLQRPRIARERLLKKFKEKQERVYSLENHSDERILFLKRTASRAWWKE